MNKINKLNNLVGNTFPEIAPKWNSESFQKKLKRVLKTVSEKQDSDKTREHTPYIKFCIDKRPEMKMKHPNLKAKELISKLGDEWKEYKLKYPEILEEKYNYKVSKDN